MRTRTNSEGSAGAAEPSVSMTAMLRKLWFLGVLGGCFEIWNMLEAGVYTPYLYSRVRCCGPGVALSSKYDILDPEARRIEEEAGRLGLPVKERPNGMALPACSVPQFPNDHRLWSKSNHCPNSHYVQQEAQTIMGMHAPVQKAFSLWVLPIGGAVADTFGRHAVLQTYIFMCVLACVIYLVDSKLCDIWGNTMVIVAGAMICPCWEPKGSIINACIADCAGRDEKTISRGMSVIYICMQCGGLIGFAFSAMCLSLHVGSYMYIWLVYSCIAVGIFAFVWLAVPETLSRELRTSFDYQVFNIVKSQVGALRVVGRDRLLIWLILCYHIHWWHFVGFITLSFTYLVEFGFTTQEAIIPALVNSCVQIACASTAAKFFAHLDTMTMYVFGNACFLCSYIAMGPLQPSLGHAGPYVGYTFIGLGFSTIVPAVMTTISDRVEQEHQAKSQAVISWTNSIGALVAPLVYNLVLFDSTATGMRHLLPIYVSMFLAVLCMMISLWMRFNYHNWPKAKDVPLDQTMQPLKSQKEGAKSYDAA